MATQPAPAWLPDDGVERQTAGGASEPPVALSHHSLYPTAADEGHGGTGQAAALLLGGASPPPGAKKGAMIRRLQPLPAQVGRLWEDETVRRLFPVLRRAWALQGAQAQVALTGRKAQRVLFGAMNLRTGQRLVWRRPNRRQEHCPACLSLLRRSSPGRRLGRRLDEAPGHLAARRQTLAPQRAIGLLWLPQPCAELKAMDQ
jgi:hypothetical protein